MHSASTAKYFVPRKCSKRNFNLCFDSSYATSDSFKQLSTRDTFCSRNENLAPDQFKSSLGLNHEVYCSKSLLAKRSSLMTLYQSKSLREQRKYQRFHALPGIMRRRNCSEMRKKDYYSFVNLTKCTEVRVKKSKICIRRLPAISGNSSVTDKHNVEIKGEPQNSSFYCKPITEGCIIIKRRH
eukprot:TRINITY_DN1359_c0_g1_i3.p1 TRINITY_DN1359_c0_g1~~TRINITY_DN1359_c0_g1_i3.p1  ORF type:complete len:183 (-),score=16.15 TRINITY_DN1359_c0_g1_i3:117-665(-)